MTARDIAGILAALLAVTFAVRLVHLAQPFVASLIAVAAAAIVFLTAGLIFLIWRTVARSWPGLAVVTRG